MRRPFSRRQENGLFLAGKWIAVANGSIIKTFPISQVHGQLIFPADIPKPASSLWPVKNSDHFPDVRKMVYCATDSL